MINITAVTDHLESNTWVASWSNGTDQSKLTLLDVEADQLIRCNNFTRKITDHAEQWIFKEVPLSGIITGLIPGEDHE